ncbi:MAG: WD40/YVTN/BNR-like repeat-containing protein [Pyrinomonadaceae bacterium]
MKSILSIFFLLSFSVCASAKFITIEVGTNADFRGLSVVNKDVIWASGTGGTVIRTTDGGDSWNVIKVPNAEKLDFRDIEAFDENTAYILSIGNGASSRIYKTTDGGKTWRLQLQNTDEKGFFDSMAFWDENNGIVQGDPVNGKFVFYRTNDGNNWNRLDEQNMPLAEVGEAAFAASGTSVIADGNDRVWLATGGSDARIFFSDNKGDSWKEYSAPFSSGTAGSGIFGMTVRARNNLVAVGGNYEKPDESNKVGAYSTDGGRKWKSGIGLRGYRSAVTWVDKNQLIAVGTNGADRSKNGGKTWLGIDDDNYNAIQAKGEKSIWAVGPKGLVKHWDPSSPLKTFKRVTKAIKVIT